MGFSNVDATAIDAIALKLGALLLFMFLSGIIVAFISKACKIPPIFTGVLSLAASLIVAFYWFKLLA
ncbi:hypothetical protein [Salibacterium aidingense]|uniref:hypothetical protein n=1 Tax=Salibacterium aidingense TaxID=384933 RepID=UPI00041F647B|nr:hypothetical protein [Salibacterium aidingense]